MSLRDGCPPCSSKQFKKNGHLYNGKQNHRCKARGCQVVLDVENRLIPAEDRALIERWLRERLSLRGICRAGGVSLTWRLGFVVECYEAVPEQLNVQLPRQPQNVLLQRLQVEADETWSLVGKKANKPWLWLALGAQRRQVLAFHGGDRSRQSAPQLWKKSPASSRQHATFHTDSYAVYDGVIPQAQHQAMTKKARKTTPIERFNGTLRQRVSRLVRATLSFSKTLDNPIGAIKYFSSHSNLELARALPL